MALRDILKESKCFKKLEIAEWDTGGEVLTIRGLKPSEQNELQELAKIDDSLEGKWLEDAQLRRAYITIAYCLGDSTGNRVYKTIDASDLKEIADSIPTRVISIIAKQAAEFTNEALKKS